jgi:hypothetical protein
MRHDTGRSQQQEEKTHRKSLKNDTGFKAGLPSSCCRGAGDPFSSEPFNSFEAFLDWPSTAVAFSSTLLGLVDMIGVDLQVHDGRAEQI